MPHRNHFQTTLANRDVDPRSATFIDPALEREFRNVQLSAQRSYLVYIVSLLLFIDLGSLLYDAVWVPMAFSNPWIMAMRIVTPASAVWFLYQALRHAESPRFEWVVNVFIAVYVGLTFIMLSVHEDYAFIGTVTMICTVFALYLLLPFSFYRQIAYACAFSALGTVTLVLNPVIDTNLFRLSQWLVFVHGVGLFASWQRHINKRQLYAAQIDITLQLGKESYAHLHNRAMVDLLSHELRNPLANIGTQAELIQRVGDPLTARYAAGIVQSVLHADELIHRWVDSDRIAESAGQTPAGEERTELPGIPLRPQIEVTLQEMRLRHSQLRVSVDDRFHVPRARIDARVFNLALINIIDNATKYAVCEADGTLRIAIRLRHRASRITVRVRDYGPGIPYDHQDRVFAKHQRIDSESLSHLSMGGTGIGMHLCQTLLNLQNARLRLHSKPGLGSAFLIDMTLA